MNARVKKFNYPHAAVFFRRLDIFAIPVYLGPELADDDPSGLDGLTAVDLDPAALCGVGLVGGGGEGSEVEGAKTRFSSAQPPLLACRRGLVFSRSTSPCRVARGSPAFLFSRRHDAQTNLGNGVAAVLGVARTLLVRRLDDEADAGGSDDRRSDRDAGAVEAGAARAGRRRGQARRPGEGGGEHGRCCVRVCAFSGK